MGCVTLGNCFTSLSFSFPFCGRTELKVTSKRPRRGKNSSVPPDRQWGPLPGPKSDRTHTAVYRMASWPAAGPDKGALGPDRMTQEEGHLVMLPLAFPFFSGPSVPSPTPLPPLLTPQNTRGALLYQQVLSGKPRLVTDPLVWI